MFDRIFFDRIHLLSLWRALSQQSLSDNIINIPKIKNKLHKNKTGQIAGTNDTSRLFDIKQSVRQGCVSSPRLFCAVLDMPIGVRRGRAGRLGLDFGDGGPTCLELRVSELPWTLTQACFWTI